MHVVTKILIVFTAVLSVFLSALMVAYSANADSVAKGYTQQEALTQQAHDDLAAARVDWKDQQTSLSAEIDSLKGRIEDLRLEKSQIERLSTTYKADIEQYKISAESNSNKATQLGATVDTLAEQNRVLSDEARNLRTELLRANQKEIELVDRNNELDNQREVLQQTARALTEQLNETKRILEMARSGGTEGTTGVNATFTSSVGPMIRSRIVDVFSTELGEMARINEGSNGGIRENMILNIVRPSTGEFVAELIIVRVDPQEAVGRINTLGRAVSVQRDDDVWSRIQ